MAAKGDTGFTRLEEKTAEAVRELIAWVAQLCCTHAGLLFDLVEKRGVLFGYDIARHAVPSGCDRVAKGFKLGVSQLYLHVFLRLLIKTGMHSPKKAACRMRLLCGEGEQIASLALKLNAVIGVRDLASIGRRASDHVPQVLHGAPFIGEMSELDFLTSARAEALS